MAAMSDYLENKLTDFVLRGQSFVPATTLYAALLTTADNDADNSKVEVSGGSYARVAIVSNMTNWAGTQGSGTTVASSGNSGTTSNNVSITFPTPTANWGTVVGTALYDAPTGGNPYFYGNVAVPRTISVNDPAPNFPVSQFVIQIDN